VLMLILERDQLGDVQWDLPTALAVLYSGPLATAFAFWASQMIVRTLGPMTTGIGYLGAPLVGVIAGIIVLGEVITALDLAGVLVTGLGIVVVLLARRPRGGSPTTGDEPEPQVAEVTLPDGAELPEPMGRSR
jgi:drug/metabolite transporter (DMT)-like permease